MSENFAQFLQSFPEKLSVQDLVSIGFYPSVKSAVSIRFGKSSPPSVKETGDIWYPRDAFIDFIRSHFQACRRGRRKYLIDELQREHVQKMPPLISVRELLRLKIFGNEDQAYSCRASGCGPSYIKVGHKVLYLRDEVLKLIELQQQV